ncbi:MAG: beta-galactosidase [Chitinophagaceae bacterium]|nr:beta-galactosidase [Chitinophagaceae bacterium]
MSKVKLYWLPVALLWICTARAQTYQLDASRIHDEAPQAIPFSASGPQGIKLSANNRYFLKNDEPWFPVMGEMHYNRVPPHEWESGILKMKSAGLSIVATYIFWNEHETAPGVWDWKGNRDLRKFVELCAKHDMYVWLRIGPWSHGEQLHGGHPEWIAKLPGRRSNDPAYISAAAKLFDQIGAQVQGLFFKEGGPIIGTQLENEYASGQAAHISTLKEMALAAGMRPVFWSVTANTVFDQDKMEVIPLQGSYCYRGWERGGGGPTDDFLYGDDQWIMTGALGKVYYDASLFPRGLCEQGAGSQMTYQNRFVVAPHVEEAHLQNQVGRGMNLIGYYMFHGGTQTPGLKEPGLPESYDFQAPVGEFGILHSSYRYLKILHHFINDFGGLLAPMQQVEPDNPVRDVYNTKDLRFIARVKNNSGFLFLNNTQVRIPMPDKEISVSVKLKNETISFPPVDLKGQTNLLLPFNLTLNDILIKYATAQPLARTEDGNTTTLFLVKPEGTEPVIAIDGTTLSAKGKPGDITVLNLTPGTPLGFSSRTGKKLVVITLTRKEAEQSWRTTINGKSVLLISDADLIVTNQSLQLEQERPDFTLKVYPAGALAVAGNNTAFSRKRIAGFDVFSATVEAYRPDIKKQSVTGKEATLLLPENIPAQVSGLMLKINYLGASCDVLQQGKVVSDNLVNGSPWLIATNRFEKNIPVQFRIHGWNDQVTGLDAELVNEIKTTGSIFKSIEAIPRYSILINF